MVADEVRILNLKDEKSIVLKDSSMFANFSPNGQHIVTLDEGSRDLKVWNLQSGEFLILRGKDDTDGGFFNANFSPDGKYIVAASRDKNVWVWSLEPLGRPISLKGHQSKVWDANFSPSGKQIVSISGDRTVRIWNLQQQLFKTQEISHANFSSHIFSSSSYLFASHSGSKLKVSSLNGGEPKILEGTWVDNQGLWTPRNFNDKSFSPDGKRILASGNVSDRDITWVWDLQTEEPTEIGSYDGKMGSFSPDNQYITTVSEAGNVKIWNLKNKKSVSLEGEFYGAEFIDNGQRIATYSYKSSTVSIWDLTGRRLMSLPKDEGGTEKIASSPNGEYIAIVSRGSSLNGYKEKNVKIWNLKNNQMLTLKGHSDSVTSAAFSPDGQYIVTTSGDTTAKLWNLSGQEVVTFQGHESRVMSASFSPDGKQIVTAALDKTIRVWSLKGLELAKFKNGQQNGNAIFSSDGQYIIVVDANDGIQVWKLENLQNLLERGCSWLRYYFLTAPESKPKFCDKSKQQS